MTIARRPTVPRAALVSLPLFTGGEMANRERAARARVAAVQLYRALGGTWED